MNFRTLFIAFLGALAISGAANAAVLVSSTGSPANQVTDFSASPLIAFDLDLKIFPTRHLIS